MSTLEKGVVSPEGTTGVTIPPVPEPYSVFSKAQKVLIVTIVALAATFSSFSGNIYYPSIPNISVDLSVSPELVNLTVTSYMIFQGLSPQIWGAIADVHGRRVTYIITFVIFFGACIGLADTKAYAQLLVLRCLQSTGSASTIAIGAGVIGDITRREERGGYMGIFQAGLLIPNAAGPILGGVFTDTLGWRAIFWFLAIYSGIFLVALIFLLPETLRSLVGNGSIPAKGLSQSPIIYFQQLHKRKCNDNQQIAPQEKPDKKKTNLDFLAPIRLIFGVEVTCAILFVAIYYTGWQMTITAMSTLFSRTYGLDELNIGLTFLGNGAGAIFGTLSTGKLLDHEYRRIKRHYAGNPADFPLEKARFSTLWIWSGLQCASILVFGWTLDKNVHMSVPIICTFVLGWSTSSLQSIITTFLVDVFPDKSASAVASLNLARCLMGAGGTAAVLPIVSGIGVGWTFTLISLVLAMASCLVLVQMKYGVRLRRKREEKEVDNEQ